MARVGMRCILFLSAIAGVFVPERVVLKGFQVFECKCAALEKVRDEQPGRSAEQVQEVARKSAAKLALADGRFKQLGVANLLDFAQGAFFLKAVDERLDRGISNALLFS